MDKEDKDFLKSKLTEIQTAINNTNIKLNTATKTVASETERLNILRGAEGTVQDLLIRENEKEKKAIEQKKTIRKKQTFKPPVDLDALKRTSIKPHLEEDEKAPKEMKDVTKSAEKAPKEIKKPEKTT